MGLRLIVISGYLIRSKTLMELTFNPRGEFRWSPEGPVSQIHSQLHTSASGIFSDLLRSIQKERLGCKKQRKLPHLFIPGKTATLVPEFAVEIFPRQNCRLCSCACSEEPALGQNSLMMMIITITIIIIILTVVIFYINLGRKTITNSRILI